MTMTKKFILPLTKQAITIADTKQSLTEGCHLFQRRTILVADGDCREPQLFRVFHSHDDVHRIEGVIADAVLDLVRGSLKVSENSFGTRSHPAARWN